MSMYGPPGGGYPGQPQDPWQGGGGDPYGNQPGGNDPYGGQPGGGDPYGGQASTPYGGQPGGGNPYGSDPYGGQPGDPYGGQPGPGPDPYGGQPGGTPYGGQPSGAPYGGGQWGAPAGGPMGQSPYGAQWGPPAAPPPKSNTGLIVGLSVVGVLVLMVAVIGAFMIFSGEEDRPIADPSPSASASESPSPSPSPSESEEPDDDPTKYDLSDAEEGDCLYDSNPSDTKAQLSYVSCDETGEDHYKVIKRIDDTTDADKCQEEAPDYDSAFTSSDDNFVLCVQELL